MLHVLTGKWRWRAAIAFVALYALCLATPTAVLALSSQAVPAHCLSDDEYGIGAMHVHQDGSSHHHSNTGSADHDQSGKCCGLFGSIAIAPMVDLVVAQYAPVTPPAASPAKSLSGRGSDRIDRPPRSNLSL
jgi:hypothetical protein